jgi:hypothetical protein
VCVNFLLNYNFGVVGCIASIARHVLAAEAEYQRLSTIQRRDLVKEFVSSAAARVEQEHAANEAAANASSVHQYVSTTNTTFVTDDDDSLQCFTDFSTAFQNLTVCYCYVPLPPPSPLLLLLLLMLCSYCLPLFL